MERADRRGSAGSGLRHAGAPIKNNQAKDGMNCMRESMEELLLLGIVTLLCCWLKGPDEFKNLLRMARHFHAAPFLAYHAATVDDEGAALDASDLSAIHVLH